MKNNILCLLAVITTAGCNSTVQTRVHDPDLHSAAETTDSLSFLQLFFQAYPKGGTFSGHPAISLYGQVDEKILRQDPAVVTSGGVVKVCYTYFENDSFKIVWKEITIGGISLEK